MTTTTITTAEAERLAVLLDELVRRIAYREDVTVLRIPADPNHDADFICRDAAAALRSLSAERDALAAECARMREALQLLHDDIDEYQRINNLGGHDNHVMRLARAALGVRAS